MNFEIKGLVKDLCLKSFIFYGNMQIGKEHKLPELKQHIAPLTTVYKSPSSTLDYAWPSRFQGEDALNVIKKLREYLNWETDPEVIINDLHVDKLLNKAVDHNIESTQTICKTLYTLQDDGQFVYAKMRDNYSMARYNPYDLVCIAVEETQNVEQLFTITASAVTQVI